jgi:valyl-tRNA synthetase
MTMPIRKLINPMIGSAVTPTSSIWCTSARFDPASIEARWYQHWEAERLFRPARPDAEPFTIVNPPPNVTGSLHIGHALDNTLQDV